jgi:hypothetical protein
VRPRTDATSDRRLIRYPTGWTLAVIDDAAAADAAAREIEAAGMSANDLIVLHGPDPGNGMDRLGSGAGPMARLRRGLQFLTMDQQPDLHVYELALAQGRRVVGVRVADEASRREAIATLQRHGGHFINRFGAWATEEISSWRGTMPERPQHLHR